MTTSTAPRAGGGSLPAALSPKDLTRVEQTHVEGRIRNEIRFGRHVHDEVLDPHRRRLSFIPGNVFAFLRWAENDFGTVSTRIDIVQAVTPGQPYQTLPFVRPGGDILLTIEGATLVDRVLSHIVTIEQSRIDPCDVAPDHWRHVAHRLGAGHEPRAYTVDRHQAWLKRQEIER